MPPEIDGGAEAPDTTDTTTEVATPDAAKSDEPAAEVVVPEVPAAPEAYKVPQKFLKEDGTADYEKLGKAYQQLEKKLGAKPNVPASSIDEYTIEMPKDTSLAIDEEASKAFKEEALKQGFSKAQYDFVTKQYFDRMEATTWTAGKSEARLKTDWGDTFETNVHSAKKAFDEFAPSDADINDPVFNHPAVMKLMARIGAELGEDELPKIPANSTSAASIKEQIAELRRSPDYYTDAGQAKMHKLYERLDS